MERMTLVRASLWLILSTLVLSYDEVDLLIRKPRQDSSGSLNSIVLYTSSQAMKRQRVEYDRRKFQTNFEAAKKDKRPKSAASLTSLLPSINHHSVLPRSPQWSLAPRLSTPRGYDSGLGPGSYDIPSTLGADQIGPRWAPDSVDRSELAERPVRYEPPPPSSPPRSPSMSPILRPVRGNDGPGPGHRHEPVSVHRLPRPRDPKAIAE